MRKFWMVLSLCVLLPLYAFAQSPIAQETVTLCRGEAPVEFQVYTTEQIDLDREEAPMNRIEARKTDGTGETLSLFFPCFGQSEYAPLLDFVDLNFDGRLDIGALFVDGATNQYRTWFLSAGEQGGYEEAPQLQDLSWFDVYPRQKLLFNREHDSAATAVWSIYRYEEGSFQPTLYRKAEILFDDRPNAQGIREFIVEYDPEGREMVLMDENHGDLMDDELYQVRYAAWMETLWQGLDSTEKPLAQMLYVNPENPELYHADEHCASLPEQYRSDLQYVFRWQLNAEPYASLLSPCPECCGEE